MFGDFEIKLSKTDNWELKFINIYTHITISDDENEYKKKNYTSLTKENDYSIEEMEEVRKEGKFVFYVLNVVSDKNKYHIQIRSGNRISLEYLVYHVSSSSIIFYIN